MSYKRTYLDSLNPICFWENILLEIKKMGIDNFLIFTRGIFTSSHLGSDQLLRQLAEDRNLATWSFDLKKYIRENKQIIEFFSRNDIYLFGGKEKPTKKEEIGLHSLACSLKDDDIDLAISNIRELKKRGISDIRFYPGESLKRSYQIHRTILNGCPEYRKIYSDGIIYRTSHISKPNATAYKIEVSDNCSYIIDIIKKGLYSIRATAYIKSFYFDSDLIDSKEEMYRDELLQYSTPKPAPQKSYTPMVYYDAVGRREIYK